MNRLRCLGELFFAIAAVVFILMFLYIVFVVPVPSFP